MRLDIDKNDFLVLRHALESVSGDKKVKAAADRLLRRVVAMVDPTYYNPPKPKHFTPIRSAWPSGDVVREPKPDGYFDSSQKVRSYNTKAQKPTLTVEDILKDLI